MGKYSESNSVVVRFLWLSASDHRNANYKERGSNRNDDDTPDGSDASGLLQTQKPLHAAEELPARRRHCKPGDPAGTPFFQSRQGPHIGHHIAADFDRKIIATVFALRTNGAADPPDG